MPAPLNPRTASGWGESPEPSPWVTGPHHLPPPGQFLCSHQISLLKPDGVGGPTRATVSSRINSGSSVPGWVEASQSSLPGCSRRPTGMVWASVPMLLSAGGEPESAPSPCREEEGDALPLIKANMGAGGQEPSENAPPRTDSGPRHGSEATLARLRVRRRRRVLPQEKGRVLLQSDGLRMFRNPARQQVGWPPPACPRGGSLASRTTRDNPQVCKARGLGANQGPSAYVCMLISLPVEGSTRRFSLQFL